MSDFDWSEFHLAQLREDPNFNIDVPIEPLPGEDEANTFFRYLREQNVISGDDEDNLQVDWERAEELDPNIARFLMACQLGDVDNILHDLEQEGLLYSSVNDNGELIWGLTEKGKAEVENLHSENN